MISSAIQLDLMAPLGRLDPPGKVAEPQSGQEPHPHALIVLGFAPTAPPRKV